MDHGNHAKHCFTDCFSDHFKNSGHPAVENLLDCTLSKTSKPVKQHFRAARGLWGYPRLSARSLVNSYGTSAALHAGTRADAGPAGGVWGTRVMGVVMGVMVMGGGTGYG